MQRKPGSPLKASKLRRKSRPSSSKSPSPVVREPQLQLEIRPKTHQKYAGSVAVRPRPTADMFCCALKDMCSPPDEGAHKVVTDGSTVVKTLR